MRQSFRRKIVNPLFSYPLHFSIPEINEALKDSPTKFFGTAKQKVFDGKSWYFPPPLLIYELFRYQKFSETQHRRVPLWNFSVLWDKKISTEIRDIALWSIKFFDTRNFLKHQRVPLRSFSVLWDKTILTENRDTLLHKVQKSVLELMFVRVLWKLISKQ